MGLFNENLNVTKAYKIVISEYTSSFILMYIGCTLCHPLSFAISVLIAVQLFGHISGVHISPVVSIAAVIMDTIDLIYVPFYIIPQFLGCFCGYVMFSLSFNVELLYSGYCATKISHITPVQGMCIELIMTMLLVMVCCSIWDKSSKNKPETVPLKFAFVIFSIAITSKNYTGGSFNSARSFVPAVLGKNFEDNWVYWVGPNLGGILGVLIYKFLLMN